MRQALAALASLLLGACGVWCFAPASDDTSTSSDPRLIGLWHSSDSSTDKAEKTNQGGQALFAVGMKIGSKTEMELVSVGLTVGHGADAPAGATVDVSRGTLRPTKIGKRDYLSLSTRILASTTEDPAEGPDVWFVVRYEMPDANTLRVFVLDDQSVATDVRAGLVSGSVQPQRVKTLLGEMNLGDVVTLDGSTDSLRAYLESHGDKIWKPDPQVFRRITVPH